MSSSVKSIVEQIGSLTMMEAAELVTRLEKEFGISRHVTPVETTLPSPETNADNLAEQTEFAVVITGYKPETKIQVIKLVRATTNLGLKEAKDLVESLPATVAEGLGSAPAAEMQKRFVDAGADIELR